MEIVELRQKLETARNTFEYRLEKVLFEVAEQTCKLIEIQGVTRSELAQRLAVTPAYITKLLNGNPNLTIKSLLKLSDVLGQRLDIHFAPKLEVAQSTTTSYAAGLSRRPFLEYIAAAGPTHLATRVSGVITSDLTSGLSRRPFLEYTAAAGPTHLATRVSGVITSDLAPGHSPTPGQGCAVTGTPTHLATQQPSEVTTNNDLALAA
jgi:transcriptional regulator with XRE-family HTH domain